MTHNDLRTNKVTGKDYYPFDVLKTTPMITIRGVEMSDFKVSDFPFDEFFVSTIDNGTQSPPIGFRVTFVSINELTEPEMDTYCARTGEDIAYWITSKMAELTSEPYLIGDNGRLVSIYDLTTEQTRAFESSDYAYATMREIRSALVSW